MQPTLTDSVNIGPDSPKMQLLACRFQWKHCIKEIMGWESLGAVRFEVGPLLQGQTRIAKFKSAYNLLIIGPKGLQCETNLWEIMG